MSLNTVPLTASSAELLGRRVVAAPPASLRSITEEVEVESDYDNDPDLPLAVALEPLRFRLKWKKRGLEVQGVASLPLGEYLDWGLSHAAEATSNDHLVGSRDTLKRAPLRPPRLRKEHRDMITDFPRELIPSAPSPRQCQYPRRTHRIQCLHFEEPSNKQMTSLLVVRIPRWPQCI